MLYIGLHYQDVKSILTVCRSVFIRWTIWWGAGTSARATFNATCGAVGSHLYSSAVKQVALKSED